jgi:hypothetical protein
MSNDNLDLRTIKLLRIANDLLNKHGYPALRDAYRDVRLLLLDKGLPKNSTALNRLEKEIQATVQLAVERHFAKLHDSLIEVSTLEAAFAAGLMREAVKADKLKLPIKTPAKKKVAEYVERSVMFLPGANKTKEMFTYDKWVNSFISSIAKTAHNLCADEWRKQNAGRAVSIESVINQLGQAVNEPLRGSAETMVRTAVNHFGTQGRLAFRDDNLDVIEREVPIVTFDNRVSQTCISISARYGQTGWPVGQSPVGYNPFHPRCRTQIGFLLKGQKELYGTRQSISGKKGEEAEESFERRKDRADGGVVKYSGYKDRAFKGEEIKAATPISRFLMDQPKWYLEDVLGKAKAEAFLSGKLDLRKLTDSSLRPLSVEKLGIN